MGFWLGLVVFSVVTRWLYEKFFVEKKEPSVTDSTDLSIDAHSDLSGLSKELIESRQAAALDKALESEAKRKRTHVKNNSTEPDEDGFIGYRGSSNEVVSIRTKDGRIYRGRIKLDPENENAFTIKERGFRESRHTLNFRDIEEIF